MKECDFIKCGSPLGEYELHCDKETKQQILKNYEITELVRFLDFDTIIFALNRDLTFKHNNDPDSHLHLKIAQVKKLKSLITPHSNGLAENNHE